MKQSFWLIILQLISIALSFFTVFYVASDIEPELYSILGINTIISSFLIALTVLGIENNIVRNLLYWDETKRHKRINIYISMGVFSRLCMFIVFLPLLIGYAFYISESKFEGQYFTLFILFIFSSLFSVINNSLRLSLVAFNQFLLAALPDFFVRILGRSIALYVFILYGFGPFILVLILLPVITSLFLVCYLRKRLHVKYFLSFRILIKIVKRNTFLAGGNIVRYGFSSLDQLLVSMFLAPEIFATFTLAKQLESIGKKVIENVFDPLVQQLVKYKGNISEFSQRKNKLKKLHLKLCGIAILFSFIAFYLVNYGVTTFGLNKYPFIKFYFCSAIISSICYLITKLKFDLISRFSPTKKVFVLELFRAVTFVLIFLIFLNFIEQEYLYLYRFFSFSILYLYLRHKISYE